MAITEYLLMSSMILVPLGTVFYLTWRLVRALENRKGANVKISDMVQQVRALRTEVTMLSGELAELDSARSAVHHQSTPNRSVQGSAS